MFNFNNAIQTFISTIKKEFESFLKVVPNFINIDIMKVTRDICFGGRINNKTLLIQYEDESVGFGDNYKLKFWFIVSIIAHECGHAFMLIVRNYLNIQQLLLLFNTPINECMADVLGCLFLQGLCNEGKIDVVSGIFSICLMLKIFAICFQSSNTWFYRNPNLQKQYDLHPSEMFRIAFCCWFFNKFIGSEYEHKSLGELLNLGWYALRNLPKEEDIVAEVEKYKDKAITYNPVIPITSSVTENLSNI